MQACSGEELPTSQALHIAHFVLSQRAKVMENVCGTHGKDGSDTFVKKMMRFPFGLMSVEDLVSYQVRRLNGRESEAAPGRRVGASSEKQQQKLGFVCSHPLTEADTWSTDRDKGAQEPLQAGALICPWALCGCGVSPGEELSRCFQQDPKAARLRQS